MSAARDLLNQRARRTIGREIVMPDRPSAPHPEAVSDLPEPSSLVDAQVAGARDLLDRDIAHAPRWIWTDLDALVGAMLPGDLVIAGALTGNGKSTFLMSQMDAFATARVPVLYFPLEVEPEVNRLRWAAWSLDVDVRSVVRQEWDRLPKGCREAIDCKLEEQAANQFIHFATPRRITFAELQRWCRKFVEEAGCRVVMLDHLHRMEFGTDASNHRVAVTDAARRLKDLARELQIVLIASAQLNRTSDAIDQYTAPTLGRLKESGGIAEEADVVLMLSRRLRRNLPDQWATQLKLGRLSERDLAEPNTMVITCRKHRLDSDALDRSVYLVVVNGRLQNRARSWQGVPERRGGGSDAS